MVFRIVDQFKGGNVSDFYLDVTMTSQRSWIGTHDCPIWNCVHIVR